MNVKILDNHLEVDAPEKGQVYQNQATKNKLVIRGPKSMALVKSSDWIKIADYPHGDGDFSYLCGNQFCRCMS